MEGEKKLINEKRSMGRMSNLEHSPSCKCNICDSLRLQMKSQVLYF